MIYILYNIIYIYSINIYIYIYNIHDKTYQTMLYNDSWRTGMLTCNVEHLLTGSDRDVLIVPHLQRTVWTFWTCSGADEVQAPVEIFVASPAKPYISGIIVRAGHAFAAIVASSVWIQTPDISIWKTQCQVEQKPKLRAEAKQLCQILSSLNQHWDSLACFVLLCLALLCFVSLCHTLSLVARGEVSVQGF